MNQSQVIHLVSNSLTHPENTASNFKVSYNVPFDLTGKKIALVDATLTKSQPNVLQEKFEFSFFDKTKKATKPTLGALTLPAQDKSFAGKYFSQGFTRDLRDGNDKILMKSVIEGNEGESIKLRITNVSGFPAMVTYFSEFRPQAVYSWQKLEVPHGQTTRGPVEQGLGGRERIYTIKLEPGQHASFRLNIHVVESEMGDADMFQQLSTPLTMTMEAYGRILEEGAKISIQPGPGNFETITDLIKHINSISDFNKKAMLTISSGYVQLNIKASVDPCTIKFGGLERHFGFDKSFILHETKGAITYTAQRPPDMTRGTHHFYIYCSLVKNVMVNDKMVPILATVDATKGKYGEQIQHPVQYPLFVDCVEGPQQNVEVTIADDTGSIKGLLMGRTKLTLAVQ